VSMTVSLSGCGENWARSLRPSEVNEEGRTTREEPPAEPVGRGQRTEVQTVGTDSLDQEASKTVIDEVESENITVTEPPRLRNVQRQPSQNERISEIEQ
jgi:hypothetical protein